MTARTLPRDRPVSALEGFLLTMARLVDEGATPAVAAGTLMARMAAERPALLGRVLAELGTHEQVADRLAALIA